MNTDKSDHGIAVFYNVKNLKSCRANVSDFNVISYVFNNLRIIMEFVTGKSAF